jgi:deferrochelatase/peroxidase EfeB
LQAQGGVLNPPKKHSLIQVYNFEDLPLITMNVARIGAQTPGMASGIAGTEKHYAVVGFGPMTWMWLTPDKPVPGGFRAFDETEIEGEDVPETEGDILLYFSSDHADLNRAIADQARDLFGKDGELIEEVVAESFTQTNAEDNLSEKILIGRATNLDTEQGSFVFTQRFQSEEEIPSTHYQTSFAYKDGLYTMTYSNNPAELEEHGDTVSRPPVSCRVFFLPSLDLLTSLRMGGIRMGSLAINAKWKGH